VDLVLSEGWTRDSETLYLHSSGVRIERRIYRGREGWILVPVDLDRAVVEFRPDAGGMEKAFAAFATGCLQAEQPGITRKVQEALLAARLDENEANTKDDEEKADEEKEDEDG